MGGIPLAVAALAFLAIEEPKENELKSMETALEAGQVSLVLQVLGEGAGRDRWVAAPAAFARVCEAAADESVAVARAGADAEKLAELLAAMAGECVAAKPEAAEPLRARAWASIAGARFLGALGKPVPPAPLLAAADDFAAAYAKEPGKGVDLTDEAAVLAEAAFLKDADVAGLFARVDTVAATAVSKHGSEPLVVGRVALSVLRRAHLAAARKEKGVEDMIQKGLDVLAPAEKAKPDDIDLLTARNDAALLVRVLGVKRPKVDFVTRDCEIPSGLLLKVPVSRLWSMPDAESGSVHQFAPGFKTLRSLTFSDYTWDTNWRMADGSSWGGDNLKGIAESNFGSDARGFGKVESKRGLLKGKLKGCDGGYLYEINGTDKDGDSLRQRSWYWKSKAGHLRTFGVHLFVYGGAEADDPAMEFVLDSIREKPKK